MLCVGNNGKKGNLFQIADISYDNAINYPINDGIFNYICVVV